MSEPLAAPADESEPYYRLLVHDFHLGLVVHGPNGEARLANPAALSLLGLTEDQLLGRTPFDAEWNIVREDGSPFPGSLLPVPQAALRREAVHNVVMGVFRPPTGDRVWLLVHADPQFDAEGRLLRVICSFSDITERKEAEEERRQLERKLQEAQKLESLGVLAGGVAHDFNNLLTAIIGYVSLARQEAAENAASRVYLDRAVESAQRAAELCRQMLAYAGRGRFVVGQVDLSRAVRDLAALLKTSASRKAALTLELADDLPPILADASQVRQVILNLVLNASESLGDHEGAVTVRTGRAWFDQDYLRQTAIDDDLPEGEYVFVEVADTGCGMDADTQRRVFEPFYTTKFTGRGLGLAAALGIARGHHGAIHLTSAPGRGTTVRVLFPKAPAEKAAPARTETASAGGVVLFVDDEPALRDLAERALRLAGFQVLTAADGREALEVFRARAAEVRVVVLDLTMPHLNGEEVLRELRRLRPRVRVVLSSGFSEPEVSRRFTDGDLAGFLQKPYRPLELVEKVRLAAL